MTFERKRALSVNFCILNKRHTQYTVIVLYRTVETCSVVQYGTYKDKISFYKIPKKFVVWLSYLSLTEKVFLTSV